VIEKLSGTVHCCPPAASLFAAASVFTASEQPVFVD
jgi:hypothetical protein